MTPPAARIIHVASGREWRGGQRQVYLLARELQHHGADQVVVTSEGSRLAGLLEEAGVPTLAKGWRHAFSARALLHATQAARGPATIFHAHDAHALTIAGLAARATRGRLVVTRRVNFPLRRRGFWHRADRVVAISEAIRQLLVEDGIAPARIALVPSGIDLQATRATVAGSIRSELGLAPTGPLVVTVAALATHKDLGTAIEAAAHLRARLPDLQWAIAGAGPLAEDLAAQARTLGVEGTIRFLGHVAEPLRLIRAADCFVLSSREEGLGTSILDAMALAVPVVATRAGGIPEMLEPDAGMLVAVGDSTALANGVEQLLRDPDLRRQVVTAAARRVDAFSAAAMADGVRAVYRSVDLER